MAAVHSAMPLRVRYVECDMQGRAFNAHYLTWVDMAHMEAIGKIAGSYQGLSGRGVDLVGAAAARQFRRPARLADELMGHVAIEAPGRTSLRSRFEFRRGDEVIAEATMIHVCVDATTFAKQEWPGWFRDQLAAAC
jgi:acyl-CoA thioester hydrolase